MNKNIFRALLLGAGAVIATQQAEAARRFRGNESFPGFAVTSNKSNPSPTNDNLNTPLPQGGADVTVNVINVVYGNDAIIHDGTHTTVKKEVQVNVSTAVIPVAHPELLDVINAAAH